MYLLKSSNISINTEIIKFTCLSLSFIEEQSTLKVLTIIFNFITKNCCEIQEIVMKTTQFVVQVKLSCEPRRPLEFQVVNFDLDRHLIIVFLHRALLLLMVKERWKHVE